MTRDDEHDECDLKYWILVHGGYQLLLSSVIHIRELESTNLLLWALWASFA